MIVGFLVFIIIIVAIVLWLDTSIHEFYYCPDCHQLMEKAIGWNKVYCINCRFTCDCKDYHKLKEKHQDAPV